MTGQGKQRSGEELLHYVKGSLRQTGYWRKRRYDLDHPSQSQRAARATMARIAHDYGRDRFGTVEIVNKKGARVQIPASVVPIMEKAKPVPTAPREIPQVSRIEQLKRMQEILASLSPST